MGRILVIGAIVLVVWVGLEIQSNGVEGAFNGFFAPAGQAEAEAITSTPRRAGDAVRIGPNVASSSAAFPHHCSFDFVRFLIRESAPGILMCYA